MPIVVTPDVELWATGWLRGALAGRSEPYAAGVFVGNVVPSPRRDRMVIFRRDGGPRADLLYETARLGVNVWATTEQEASDLARLVQGLLLSVQGVGPVTKVDSLSGPSAIADVQPRRYLTVEAVVRGDVS